MSCHDIGRGMNSVVKVVVELYDDGKIDKKAAMKIIRACKDGVNWCDGNDGEAIDYIRRCRCGKCFKMIPKGEKLYSVWDVSNEVPDKYKIDDRFELALDGLCQDCFDIVLNEYCQDNNAGERERNYIEKDEDPKYFTSTGQYEEDNNGYLW